MRWLNLAVRSEITGSSHGWCCAKHELEYSPKELELFDISVEWQPHHHPIEKFARSIYTRVQQSAKADRTHEVVHFSGSPNGFVLAIKPSDVHADDKGDLNVDL